MNKQTSCDSSVLINFLKINRIDLFAKCSHSFFITDHVQEEISVCFPEQRARLELGLRQNILQTLNVELPQELALFMQLSKTGQLGAGECAAIAVASHRNYYLAIDDNQAIKKASERLPASRILRTQDLVVQMIQDQALDIDEANHLIELWAKHRFKLKITDFASLMGVPSA